MTTAAERWEILKDLDDWLRLPMAILSVFWLLIMLTELIWGESDMLSSFGLFIWGVFIVEFFIRFFLAPIKGAFLRKNWLTIVALIVPALRLFRTLRLVRAARALRGARLVRIISTANRSMKTLQATLKRRHFGYVLGLTALVIIVGAAGMLNFEPASSVAGGFTSYGHALWWTAMLVSSIGADFWPASLEGRVLTMLLSVYGLTVFGYITASFASFFVGRDAETPETAIIGRDDIKRLSNEIRELRQHLISIER